MKVEVGMYARTTAGTIEKIIDVKDSKTYGICKKIITDKAVYFCREEIGIVKKAGYNIIDLIEVNDYVNGNKVTSIHYKEKWLTTNGTEHIHVLCDDQVKTIITKEQLKEIEYRVEEIV